MSFLRLCAFGLLMMSFTGDVYSLPSLTYLAEGEVVFVDSVFDGAIRLGDDATMAVTLTPTEDGRWPTSGDSFNFTLGAFSFESNDVQATADQFGLRVMTESLAGSDVPGTINQGVMTPRLFNVQLFAADGTTFGSDVLAKGVAIDQLDRAKIGLFFSTPADAQAPDADLRGDIQSIEVFSDGDRLGWRLVATPYRIGEDLKEAFSLSDPMVVEMVYRPGIGEFSNETGVFGVVAETLKLTVGDFVVTESVKPRVLISGGSILMDGEAPVGASLPMPQQSLLFVASYINSLFSGGPGLEGLPDSLDLSLFQTAGAALSFTERDCRYPCSAHLINVRYTSFERLTSDPSYTVSEPGSLEITLFALLFTCLTLNRRDNLRSEE